MRGNGNGTRRPEEIQAEIAHTRAEMDATLNAIEHRLTPGQLVDQGIDYLRNSGARQYITNLGGSVKDNPIPTTLAGIGLAWLMASANRPVQYKFIERGGERPSEPGAMDKARDKAHQASDRISAAAQSARNQVERVRSGWDTMLNEHPLALGAIGLAIGAIAAAIVPRTETEDEMMGPARDRVLDEAKRAAKEKSASLRNEPNPEPRPASEPQASTAPAVQGDSSQNPPSFTQHANLDSGPRRPT